MDDLTSKMDGVTVEEVLAATVTEFGRAPGRARSRGLKFFPGSALTAAVGERV